MASQSEGEVWDGFWPKVFDADEPLFNASVHWVQTSKGSPWEITDIVFGSLFRVSVATSDEILGMVRLIGKVLENDDLRRREIEVCTLFLDHLYARLETFVKK
jgi:hypothetical protein